MASPNFNRMLKKELTIPVIAVVVAIVLWPLSWQLAVHTVVSGGFTDFWTGAVSIMTGLAAVVTTAIAIGGIADVINHVVNNDW